MRGGERDARNALERTAREKAAPVPASTAERNEPNRRATHSIRVRLGGAADVREAAFERVRRFVRQPADVGESGLE